MQVLPPIGPTLVAALAISSGAIRWWRGRSIRADDPALPERLMARRRSDGWMAAACLVATAAVAPRSAWWSVPLLLLSTVVGGWPLRRRVFAETWSLPVYVVWILRLVAALWGFWLALMLTPVLVDAAGAWAGVTAVALGLVMIAWQRQYGRLVLWWLGARRWPEDDWPDGFARVLGGARVSEAPRIWRTGPPGSSLANALALPSLHGSHVLFTDPLIERLDRDELTAVLAHEVSHLELFTPTLLRRWQMTSWACIAVSLVLAPILRYAPPEVRWMPLAAWPALVLVVVSSRGRVIRAQETPSDRRAVELCGNPEAVVSGLVKLHETGKLPRRWAAEHERRASHPSLARRIKAIREAAGHPAPAVTFPIVVRGTAPTAMLIEADRVRHLSGVAPEATTADALVSSARTIRSVPWADIAELRVDVPRSGRPTLVLSPQSGERWGVELDPSAVAGVQQALDAVDDRLPAVLPAPARDRPTARIALLVLAAVALVTLHWSSLLLCVVFALVAPATGPLLASVAATMVAVALAIGQTQASSASRLAAMALSLGPAALVAWLAWRARHEAASPRRLALVYVGLGASAVACWIAAMAWSRGDPFDLHLLTRSVHGLVVLPIALAVAWAWSREPRLRRLMIVPLLLALVGLVLSTSAFVDAFVHDPLGSSGPEIPLTPAAFDETASTDVDPTASGLTLSPSGRTYVVRTGAENEDEDEEAAPGSFVVGTFAGTHVGLQALTVDLLDDDTALTLERDGDSVAVRARPLATPTRVAWSATLPGVSWGALTSNVRTRRWRVEVPLANRVRVFEGVVGDPAVGSRTWMPAAAAGTPYTQWLASDGAPLGRVYDYRQMSSATILATAWTGLRWRMPLVLSTGEAQELRSHFDGNCYEGAPGVPVICVASDGSRHHLWAWNGRGLEAAGSIDGAVTVVQRSRGGWLTGWRNRQIVLVDPGGTRAWRVADSCVRGWCVSQATYDGTVFGGLVLKGGRTSVAVGRLRPLSPPRR